MMQPAQAGISLCQLECVRPACPMVVSLICRECEVFEKVKKTYGDK